MNVQNTNPFHQLSNEILENIVNFSEKKDTMKLGLTSKDLYEFAQATLFRNISIEQNCFTKEINLAPLVLDDTAIRSQKVASILSEVEKNLKCAKNFIENQKILIDLEGEFSVANFFEMQKMMGAFATKQGNLGAQTEQLFGPVNQQIRQMARIQL